MSEKIRAEAAARFGRALRAARDRQGLTQHQLEESTGISRPSIARYESGRRCPPLAEALVLAHRLGFSLDELA
jgi:transcriptional regulator with XRE-family HTH domain